MKRGKQSSMMCFTRGEAEALMLLIHHVGVTSVWTIQDSEKEAIKTVYSDLPIAARDRIVKSLNAKIWGAWADTHPEEGPFK